MYVANMSKAAVTIRTKLVRSPTDLIFSGEIVDVAFSFRHGSWLLPDGAYREGDVIPVSAEFLCARSQSSGES